MTTQNTFVLKQIFLSAAVAVVTTLAVVGFAHADSLPGLPAQAGVDIHIGASGNAQVEGAKVTAVSGSDVSANTSLGTMVLNWLLKTDSNTQITARGGASGLANIAVGDVISFRGALDQTVAGLTVKAKAVKHWSKVEAKTHISGTVTAINSSLNSFVVSNGSATTTVQTNSSTKLSTNGKAGTFADLFVSAKVRLMGMFNASSSIFSAASVDIASSTKKHSDDGNSDDNRNDWMHGFFRGDFWIRLFGNH